ncbi:MAG: ANTAR domain-containing protein [Oscillospiraceae bacterium]|nr:ANTAR domain-containing protein [Oscillospiraceae bacterium]
MVFQERTYSVLLVSASEKLNSTVLPLLPSTDYWPVHTVKSVSEAQRRLLEQSYDIVLINAPLPDDFGLQLAISTCAGSSAGVLLLVHSDVYNEVYAKSVVHGVVTLSKPTSLQMIAQSLRVLCATRERLRSMEEKRLTVEQKIEEMRTVNRAKWLLIEHEGMTEAEAHRRIEKQSMDRRLSKREIAEQLIQTYQT